MPREPRGASPLIWVGARRDDKELDTKALFGRLMVSSPCCALDMASLPDEMNALITTMGDVGFTKEVGPLGLFCWRMRLVSHWLHFLIHSDPLSLFLLVVASPCVKRTGLVGD